MQCFFRDICLLSDIKVYWNAIYKWCLHSSGAPASSVLIRPPADLHMILHRFRAIRCSYLIKTQWSDEMRHSQDPSQSLLWPLTSLGRTGTEAQQHLLAAKQPAMCLSQCLCEWIYSYRKCDCVSSGRKNTCAYVCESMLTCDRVLQRGRLAAWAWTLHAFFMSLTSDKAEALLVMMWLLLPIMPHCRPGRKTVRYIHCVPHRLPTVASTLWLFYEAFST